MLILSYFANVDALAPSVHIDDKLQELSRRGINLDLISSTCGRACAEWPHLRVPAIAPSGLRYELRYFLRRRMQSRFWHAIWMAVLFFPLAPFYLLEKALIRLDSQWSWALPAAAAAIARSMAERPDIIFSTGGPASAHRAAMIASRIMRIPHIAELQDPLVYAHDTFRTCRQKFKRNLETALCNNASAVIFLTEQAAASAAARNPSRNNIHAVYSGAASRTGADVYEKTSLFRIAHFGSLAGTRNLSHLFSALKALFDERPETLQCLRVALYGNIGKNVWREMARFPHREVIETRGKVSRQEALNAMRQADVLLFIQNTDDVSYETIPSKVYEYLQTGRPILGLTYRSPEVRSMIERMGHVQVPADDPRAIREALEGYMNAWESGNLKTPLPASSPYTVEASVDRLIALAGELRR